MKDYIGDPSLNIYNNIDDMIDNDKSLYHHLTNYIICIEFNLDTFHHLLSKYSNDTNYIYMYLHKSKSTITMQLVDIIDSYTKDISWIIKYRNIDIETFEYIISNGILSDNNYTIIYNKPEHIDIFHKYAYYNALCMQLGDQLTIFPTNYQLIEYITGLIRIDEYKSYLNRYTIQSHDILNTIDEIGIDMYLRIISTLPYNKSTHIFCKSIVSKLVVDIEILHCIVCHIIIKDDSADYTDEGEMTY